MKLIKLNIIGHLNPSRLAAQNQFHRRNPARTATLHINICTTTTVKNKLNCSAKFARQPFKLIIVFEDHLKPNTFVPTASTLYSAGNPVATSLFTNAVTITVRTDSTPLTNSIRRKKSYKELNLLNSNSTTSIVNIYSKPMSSSIRHHSNHSSILQKFIILKMSSD